MARDSLHTTHNNTPRAQWCPPPLNHTSMLGQSILDKLTTLTRKGMDHTFIPRYWLIHQYQERADEAVAPPPAPDPREEVP